VKALMWLRACAVALGSSQSRGGEYNCEQNDYSSPPESNRLWRKAPGLSAYVFGKGWRPEERGLANGGGFA
jgi:hypothetical protein